MVNEVNLICQELVPPQPLRFSLRVQAKRSVDRFSNVFTQQTEVCGVAESAHCNLQLRVDVHNGSGGDLLAVWSIERFQERAFLIREIYANVRVVVSLSPVTAVQFLEYSVIEVSEADNPFIRLHEEQAELLGHSLVYLKVHATRSNVPPTHRR
jgi:hypothetical protein